MKLEEFRGSPTIILESFEKGSPINRVFEKWSPIKGIFKDILKIKFSDQVKFFNKPPHKGNFIN